MQKGLLLAESGSSKTEWRLCEDGKIVQAFRSPGFNPNIQTEDAMKAVFREVIQHVGYEKAHHVIFYGAGLGEISQRKVMFNILKDILPEVEINIEHDMLAAVRSTLKEEGIVCILGTGSNSAYYKGDEIIHNLGGHGYLFGDEGSGLDIGKRMLKAMLQDDLPRKVIRYFEEKEQHSLTEIKLSVMKSEKPNVKLATFAKYTADLVSIARVRNLVKASFLDFLDTTVCRYENYQTLPVDFVGSIGFYFKDILEEACERRMLTLGNVIKDPVENLIAYHFKKNQ